jgi:hypothetical protein
MKYVVFFECKEKISQSGAIVTAEGTLAVVINEPDGWVEATSRRVNTTEQIPGDVKLFETEEAAVAFIKRWKGHPWYFVPSKNFEVVAVAPKMVTVQQGWERK